MRRIHLPIALALVLHGTEPIYRRLCYLQLTTGPRAIASGVRSAMRAERATSQPFRSSPWRCDCSPRPLLVAVSGNITDVGLLLGRSTVNNATYFERLGCVATLTRMWYDSGTEQKIFLSRRGTRDVVKELFASTEPSQQPSQQQSTREEERLPLRHCMFRCSCRSRQ